MKQQECKRHHEVGGLTKSCSSTCTKCEKPTTDEFRTCISCRTASAKYRQKCKMRWRSTGLCAQCGKRPPIRADGRGACQFCRSQAMKYTRECRAETFLAYGGPVCACCGETQDAFLTLDHVNGGGNAERKKIGKSS